jgi:hypothetical protein
VGIGDTTQEQRAQTLPCKFGDPTTAITHLDTSLLQLPATKRYNPRGERHQHLTEAEQVVELSVRPGSSTMQPDIGSTERDDEAVSPATLIVRALFYSILSPSRRQDPALTLTSRPVSPVLETG